MVNFPFQCFCERLSLPRRARLNSSYKYWRNNMIIIILYYHWTIGILNIEMAAFSWKKVARPNHCISMKNRMHGAAAATFILSYSWFKCASPRQPQQYFSTVFFNCISQLYFWTVILNSISQLYLSTVFSTVFVKNICQQCLSKIFVNSICQKYFSTVSVKNIFQ